MPNSAKSHLTNEKIRKKFKSNFELVNYAIKLAENMIKTGRDARVKSDVENRALLVLEEIYQGKDQFDEIKISSTGKTDESMVFVQHTGYEEKNEKKHSHKEDVFVEDDVT